MVFERMEWNAGFLIFLVSHPSHGQKTLAILHCCHLYKESPKYHSSDRMSNCVFELGRVFLILRWNLNFFRSQFAKENIPIMKVSGVFCESDLKWGDDEMTIGKMHSTLFYRINRGIQWFLHAVCLHKLEGREYVIWIVYSLDRLEQYQKMGTHGMEK